MQLRYSTLAFLAGILWPIYAIGSVPSSAFDVAAGTVIAIVAAHGLGRGGRIPRALWLLALSAALVGLMLSSGASMVLGVGLSLAVIAGALVGKRPAMAFAFLHGYAVGASVSALVAVTDRLGLTTLSPQTFTVGQSGLSSNRSYLAVELGLALLVCLHHSGIRSRYRWPMIVTLTGGLLVSGGRGGVVAIAAAYLGAFLLSNDRRFALRIIAAGVVVLVLLGSFSLPTVDRLLARDERQRVSLDAYSSGRIGVASLALHDLNLWGAGFGRTIVLDDERVTQAHNVVLIALYSGGLLFGAVVLWVLVVATLRARRSLRGRTPEGRLAGLLTLYLVAWSLFSTGPLGGTRRMLLFAVVIQAVYLTYKDRVRSTALV